jgi:predicted DNA-binding transcriptional regulator AlpA
MIVAKFSQPIFDDVSDQGGSVSAATPEAGMDATGSGGETVTEAGDDDDGGDGDGDPDRRRSHSTKKFFLSLPPALLGFDPLSRYVQLGRSRIYQLIGAGEFPPPIKVGYSSRWVRAEVDQWLSERIAARQVSELSAR